MHILHHIEIHWTSVETSQLIDFSTCDLCAPQENRNQNSICQTPNISYLLTQTLLKSKFIADQDDYKYNSQMYSFKAKTLTKAEAAQIQDIYESMAKHCQ